MRRQSQSLNVIASNASVPRRSSCGPSCSSSYYSPTPPSSLSLSAKAAPHFLGLLTRVQVVAQQMQERGRGEDGVAQARGATPPGKELFEARVLGGGELRQ